MVHSAVYWEMQRFNALTKKTVHSTKSASHKIRPTRHESSSVSDVYKAKQFNVLTKKAVQSTKSASTTYPGVCPYSRIHKLVLAANERVNSIPYYRLHSIL